MVTERAKAIVDLDGQAAGKEIERLTQHAKDLRKALQDAEKAGDFKSAKKIRNDLKLNSKELREFKKATQQVNVEMNKLNGMTFTQLRKAYGQLRKARDNAKPDTKEWKEYDDQLKKVRQQMDKVGGSMSRGSKLMSTFKSVLPILSMGALSTAVVGFAKNLYGLAITLEGDARRANIVFGDSLGYVEDEAKKLSKQMGLTNKEFVAAAANTADLLIPLDFTREASAKMSVELQSLAGALDEWTGGRLGASEVSNILTKAMLGENEQLKQLGIAIRKDTDEFRDLVKEKLKVAGVTKIQAEAMATLELIQYKSADAQTAYTQSGNELLRLQKSLSRGWNQMKEDIIGFIADGLKSASTEFNEQAKSVKNLEDNVSPLITEYDSLSKKTTLSEAEQARLNKIIVTIGNNLPGAITQFDEYGRVIGISSEKAKELIDIQRAMLLVKNADAIQEQEDALQRVNVQMGVLKTKISTGWMTDSGEWIKYNNEEVGEFANNLADLGKQKMGIEGLLKVLRGEEILPPETPANVEKVTTTIKSLEEEVKKLKEAKELINTEDEAALIQNQKEIEAKQALIDKYKDLGKTKEKLIKDQEKEQAAQEAYIVETINSSRSLVDQENIAYEERLKKAGLFGKKKEDMSKQELKALEVLSINHIKNIDNIHTKSNEDLVAKQKESIAKFIENLQEAYIQEGILRETQFNEELLALGDNEKAKADLTDKYNQEEIQRKLAHLTNLRAELEATLADGINIENAMLTDEERDDLLAKIDVIKLSIAQLKVLLGEDQGNDEEKSPSIIAQTIGDLFTLKQLLKEGEISQEEYANRVAEIWANLKDNLSDAIQNVGNIAMSAFGSIDKIISNGEKRQLQEYEKNNRQKRKLLDERLDAGAISQEQYNARVSQLDQDLEKEKRKIAHEQAKRAKAMALMGAIVNTAVAVTGALGNPPGPAGIAMAVIVGLLGALEIAAIATEPIPALASGNYQSLTADDGKNYRAKVAPKNHKSGLYNEPTYVPGFGMFGETADPELVFNPEDTQTIMNTPELIEAINNTIGGGVRQYAGGNAREIIRENNTVTETYSDPAMLAMISEIRDYLKQPAQAVLVADEDYIKTHQEKIEEYDAFQKRVG